MLINDSFSFFVVKEVIEQTDEALGSRNAVIITGAEMDFVAKHYSLELIVSIEDADEAIGASKTVKDSIEKLFFWLPGQKAILHALNEIMSLGRGI